ncbi:MULTISPECIES: bifunctional alpha,alpha-trehalose-phosphate synthase (UDP-forming)/trehalose-phosphatase [unclassified Mucilaginibacter]|uniref:bifunctional alpha,alpha-trehalose-phosphate synthase (UDP-forming)/trehalose-phosphatase n=1 Tax=unclassified Mucilaginibacter TaxID=2617802 RepID=UPI002AC93E01|nr:MULTISPECIES: bifunctional alpha,alpha-trehalose-phosphate synthase (UDP-forming)/trehalose-phosphatase [unclassified Mucilaginibacter]MEB0262827.1 bifunctional alpha,alpha-trehalose-phosphate synthase (UDP-forming)/trehalose-phosphatase [Mucilaginibacter sp. 10I4]MEB0277666.1 bifunctional alpha,alpha-trehalose-phosphate synthase (UDP-forming)/trehalose-phosphatase [Mucilaginibacter sp. 10B2]MEB0301925.1 bifunctional alpha,alpha-trehalose-phosphate synthase (UDP-forming)/trehalose-phosphatase
MKKKLYIVANRLPITIEHSEHQYTYRPSSGGLVSAITTYLGRNGKDAFSEKVWAGVPECNEAIWNDIKPVHETGDFNYLPVFANAKKYDLYYNGFSNSLLWPLFHYFPSFAEYRTTDFDAYMSVNKLFASVLAGKVTVNDVVWIHDYHLLPLAAMLREIMPGLTIGLFLHIPFPAYEIFRVIPKLWQREILSGMMGADLIGFHTVEYSSYFLSSVEMSMKIKSDGNTITWQNRKIKVEAFPISIDFELFNNAAERDEVKLMQQNYLMLKGDKKMIFSVDRLDYTKGIQNRLRGFKTFLDKNTDYIGKVVFALIVVPSRDGIKKYAERKRAIDEFISNLNSTIGTINWQPIIYQYSHLSFEELIALYTTCDLALITPLRDGMNLVAKEFVASRKDEKGVLVLSEMAGAARELTEALLINPNDITEIAAMIKQAIEMDTDEQAQRMQAMQTRIKQYDVVIWATNFFDQLQETKKLQMEFNVKMIDSFSRAAILKSYAKAKKRLLLFDYDGTLVPFSKQPALAFPPDKVIEILSQLSAIPENEVVIISGRDSVTLEKWLGKLPMGLIAEHGAKIRLKDFSWENKTHADNQHWMNAIQAIMNKYVSKCPNSFIEKKEFALAWHYRNADISQGELRAKELYEYLIEHTSTMPLSVLNGHKVIEVRNKGISKGISTLDLLLKEKYDFILCIGDDQTDEDMFKVLTGVENACTIKVGQEASFAQFNLQSPYLVQSFLDTIISYPTEPTSDKKP